jgi:hypothetical protein
MLICSCWLLPQVVYTQNIILAIVAEAYEEAKAKLGTADTSFLLLVLMRMLFTTLFIIYRLRMFFGDVIFESTGWQGPNAKLRRPASQTTAGTSSSTNTPASGDDQGPDGQGGASFLRRDASDRSNGPFGRPIAVQGLDQASVDSGLQPTESRAVLPFDVEIGLTESQPSRLRLLGRSFAASHQYAGSSSALGAASDRYADTAADQGLAAGGCRTLGGQSRGVGTKKPAGFWDRLSVAWHDVILGERHVLRMYNDVYLATGQVRLKHILHGCSYYVFLLSNHSQRPRLNDHTEWLDGCCERHHVVWHVLPLLWRASVLEYFTSCASS